MDNTQQAYELERIAELIRAGYVEGEVTNEDYQGWWFK